MPFSCSRSTAPRSLAKVVSTPITFCMMPLMTMKKMTPTRSWMPFWSFPTSHQMRPSMMAMAIDWPNGARARILLRLRSLKPRLSNVGKVMVNPGTFADSALDGLMDTLFGTGSFFGLPSLSELPSQASTSCRRRSLAALEPSSLVRTCMNKKSAGFAYCGQGKPAVAKWVTASTAPPLKTTCPSKSSMRLSNKAKMSDDGWCMVQTIVLCVLWAKSLMILTSKWALKASRPLVGSSRKRIFGSRTTDMATAQRFRSPPLRPFTLPTGSPTGVSAHASSSNSFRTLSACASLASLAMSAGSVSRAAICTASRAVCEAMMASSCCT
mmetsp:Transcript_7125/g.18220  ORF Transcript_7125/g.18220 Transcript_7125/m.18220 type:complete len:325 (+) Transcript_7125:124-1098(+)